jgi:hypothetical protein
MSTAALERAVAAPMMTAAPAAAHMIGMTTTAIAEDARSSAPISLAPGYGDDFTWLAANAAIEHLDVHRYETGDYVVCPSQIIDFTAMFCTEAAPDAFLDRHERLIGDFMREHYGAQMEGDDWDAQELECVAALPEDASPTGTDVLNAALTKTAILRLSNDSASASLAALLTERITGSVVVADRNAAVGVALRMDAAAIDTETLLRCGRREISDATALAIARSFGAGYPTLARLGRSGYAITEDLQTELRGLYEEHRSNARLALRIDMMSTWALNGGDSS